MSTTLEVEIGRFTNQGLSRQKVREDPILTNTLAVQVLVVTAMWEV
jgi:hypothetical protein